MENDVMGQLLKVALSLHKKGMLAGHKDLIRSLIAAIGESYVAYITEGEIVNGNYDVLGRKNYAGRIEVKTAYQQTAGTFGAWSLFCKRNKCDYFAIVDASNVISNKYRVSMIPHDEMFNILETPNRNGKTPDYFKWSASYNVNDKKSKNETDLFLKYEVVL